MHTGLHVKPSKNWQFYKIKTLMKTPSKRHLYFGHSTVKAMIPSVS